jgi:hypothetical protein
MYKPLYEGGNVFKDSKGQPATQRINQTDIKPTIAWLDQMLPDLNLMDNMLGSTGLKPTSGDLDLAIDANKFSKEQLVAALTSWCRSQGLKPEEWIKKSGISVHFKTPITGRVDHGFVQTDFMFLNNVPFSKFILRPDVNSKYQGALRNIMINSMAKSLGYKLNQNSGLANRETNEIITDDPDELARLLLNKKATAKDLGSVETIMAALANDPKREQKIADFHEHMAREKIAFEESLEETEVNFLARLRDRIVNQGMYMLIEGKDPRIPHLEDLVFDRGTAGIKEALKIVSDVAADTGKTTTIKWDGKPAIIFGRKPTGEFVLTDKSGFTAKGYDGLATSPQQIAKIMSMRSGERGELIEMYATLFPLLNAAVPKNFRGYILGDLLYTSTPPEESGAYVFRPNFVEYRIPAASELGQRIGNSQVGVAIHTYYEDPDAPAVAIQNADLKTVPGLLIVEPTVKNMQNVRLNRKLVNELKQLVAEHGGNINQFFNPAELRAQGITDLPALCKQYINSRINTNFDNLLPDFGAWLQQKVTPRKYNNIVEYVQSPRSNMDGISAAFTAFLALHDLKLDLLQQLDRQQPGQEGWVMATDAGRAKLVNRFGFSAGNRALNNPELVK